MFYGAAEFTSGRFTRTFLGLANCSAGVSTFQLVSKFDRYYDGRMIFYNSLSITIYIYN